MNTKKQNSIEIEHNFFSLIKFSLPTIIMMIVSGLYTIVDSIFISNFVGTDALSAINIVFPIINLIIGIAVMYSSGSNAIIANKLGQKKIKEANDDFSTIVFITLLTGIFITIFSLIFIDKIIYILGANDNLFNYCKDYIVIIVIFCIPYMFQLLFQSFYITDGHPELGLILTLIGGITNVILDYLFIVKFNWGIKGAAFATSIGTLINGGYGIYYFIKKSSTIRITKPKINLNLLTKSCFNGSSEMISNLSVGITTFLFNKILMEYIGSDGVASITIIMYVQYLLITLYLGFSLGVSPVISYNYGAKNKVQLEKIFNICMKFIIVASILMYLISIGFRVGLISIFSRKGSSVYEISENGFVRYSISFLFVGINIFASSLFTALGNGVISGIISTMRSLVFIIFGLIVFPTIIGLNGVWFAVPFSEIATFFITLGFLAYGKKHYGY